MKEGFEVLDRGGLLMREKQLETDSMSHSPAGGAEAATFSLGEEDHTLANSVRFVLNRDPRVSFCGYSVPHPSENRVNIRVQTTGDPASTVFKDALQDLMAVSVHVRGTFEKSVAAHKAAQNMKEMSIKSGVTHQSSSLRTS